MKKISLVDLVSVVSLMTAATVTAAVYARLPERVTTHFDFAGHPNGWMSRAAGAWALPVFGAVLWAVLRFSARLVPARHAAFRQHLAASPVALSALIVTLAISAIQILILRFALSPADFDMGRATWFVLGAIWVALGLVFPRVRRNPLIGVRTTWTLSSDENWARTHRVASYACVLGGLVAVASAAVGGRAAYGLALAAFILSGVVPVAYSWLYARRA